MIHPLLVLAISSLLVLGMGVLVIYPLARLLVDIRRGRRCRRAQPR